MNTNYINKHFFIHWNIPTDLFETEEQYPVKIFLMDVYVLKLFKTIRWKHIAARWETEIQITEPKKAGIEIQKFMKPNLDQPSSFNSNNPSVSGWICVKVYNDTDKDHKSCFGTIKTDAGKFTLYDYHDILTATEATYNGKGNPFFTLEAHSPKILCAKITARESRLQ